VITEAFKRILVAHGTPPEKIHVIQNTARSDLFHDGISGAGVRGRLRLDRAAVVGFLGKAVPWHGVDKLLIACGDVAKRHANLHVVIVGDTSGHPGLPEIAQRAGLKTRVHFVGQVPHSETPEYIAAMDIAVMPNSNTFGSPVKLFEYMAMRRAFVAPRLGPIEEVFEDGKHALLVEPGDAASIATAIGRLLDDPAERDRLGAEARRHFDAGYSWERNADRTVAILSLARERRAQT
jgi:glycosyltransferase involved in cell wall biosynthesis